MDTKQLTLEGDEEKIKCASCGGNLIYVDFYFRCLKCGKPQIKYGKRTTILKEDKTLNKVVKKWEKNLEVEGQVEK